MSYPIIKAERVLDDLQITSPDDLQLLEQIAWERGALVRYINLEGAEARLMAIGKPAIITVSTSVKDIRRRRFSIAHELGHFEMHRFQNSLSLCTTRNIDDWWTGTSRKGSDYNQEQEANLFASALLLPERFFASLCNKEDPSFDYISDLAARFNVSLTSTAIRFLLFSEEPLAIVWSQENHIRWFQESKAFAEIREDLRFFIDVRSKLDNSTQASSYFTSGGISPGVKLVQASAWFTSGEYSESATIKEHSIALPSYNATLSLLWIDDVIDEIDDIDDEDEY